MTKNILLYIETNMATIKIESNSKSNTAININIAKERHHASGQVRRRRDQSNKVDYLNRFYYPIDLEFHGYIYLFT